MLSCLGRWNTLFKFQYDFFCCKPQGFLFFVFVFGFFGFVVVLCVFFFLFLEKHVNFAFRTICCLIDLCIVYLLDTKLHN